MFSNKSNIIVNVVVGLIKTLFRLFKFSKVVYLLRNTIPHFVVHGSQHVKKKCSTCSHYDKKSVAFRSQHYIMELINATLRCGFFYAFLSMFDTFKGLYKPIYYFIKIVIITYLSIKILIILNKTLLFYKRE
jgi:hypothetical protein